MGDDPDMFEVVEDVKSKQTATELSTKEVIDNEDEDWWLAVERIASQIELTYTATNSEC